MNQTSRVPLRPDYGATQRRNARLLHRAVAAFLSGHARASFMGPEAARIFQSDRDLGIFIKAVSSPTTTATAEPLAVSAVSDSISILAGVSAGARIFDNGLKVTFDSAYGIQIPTLTASAGNAGWIAQGSPIPVKQLDVSASAVMVPHKLAVLVVATRETFDRSTPTIEAIIRAVFFESFHLKLDETLLSTAAGTTIQSAGIRYGIAALPASASADPLSAMLADVKAAVSAVATVAANSPIMLVASPTQAVTLRAWPDRVPYTVMGSSAIADGDLIAVASNCIASAVNEVPRIEFAKEALLHMEDANPLAIGTAGSPNTVAASSRSLWQTDTVAARIILEASWMRRSDSGVAWVTGATW